MIGAPPQIPLPTPTRTRWQPLRIGLIELFHYDVEEFWFRDGHLLLRGNNGTGKSKVLSLTLPFLLDANLASARVEPDGERNKRMEWNLLMGGRHDRRTGYTWIEFGRIDESGEEVTLTLGCGLRAVAGRAGADPWYFITDQRIGADLWLTTAERAALSKERLIEAIGTHGQVFPTAQAYRRAVDERLFRLGAERYGALVDTLIQLRQPQLSKSPDERRLSEALTQALPPLDRAALEDVAEAMSELDDIRRGLNEIEAIRKAITSFGARYRRYAQVATRRKARVLRQAQTDFDNASREVNTAEKELEKARSKVSHWQSTQYELEQQLAGDAARLRVLQSDPVMRDATRLSDAREKARECKSLADEARAREKNTHEQLVRETTAARRRREHADTTRAQLNSAFSSANTLASDTGIDKDHAQILLAMDLPDGVGDLTPESPSALMRQGRDAESRRREQIALVRKRLRTVDSATHLRDAAHDARTLRAEAFDEASAAAHRTAEELRDGAELLLENWRHYASSARALHIPDIEESLESLALWQQSLSGPNPTRAALDRVRLTQEQRFATRDAEIAGQRCTLEDEHRELAAERTRLESGEDRTPPAPHTRDPALRGQLAGAPLWQLIDFAPHVPPDARAGLEAALEASGLLDAWVLPQGTLIDPRTNDILLVARAPYEHSLVRWAEPTVPTIGQGAEIHPETITAILESIACAEQEPAEAETWVSPGGEFRVGNVRGAWTKSAAQYIGHAAREATRRARLGQIAARLAEIDAAIADRNAAAAELTALREAARREYESAPSDEGLLRLHAEHNSAEQRRRNAQTRLGEADAKLAQAEHGLTRARDDLAIDSRDLNLPTVASDLDRLDHALGEYRLALSELANAIRHHQSALVELKQQIVREQQAMEALEAAQQGHLERQKLLTAATETANTLQATVGKQVEELLQEIEATDQFQRRHDRELKDAQAKLIVASSNRGTAEATLKGLSEKLDERVQSRRLATEALQAYAARTGFIAIAVPELEVPVDAAPWGIEAALTLARRAEAALTDVSAEEADWVRISRDVGNDFTQLQSTMSTQGHSATAEPSDHGLIVRIVYQQRPERPDVLEERLDAELAEQRLILSAQERSLLEEHLEKEVAANLQRMISETEERVAAINAELYKRPTSTGMRYRLVWEALPESDGNSVPGLAVARKRLLNTSADAWSAQDRHQVGEFLRARIDAERQRDERGTLFETLARALDYRRWHSFSVERNQDRQWKPLSGPASSGERALGLTVPLFAAASSHYQSSDPRAPRLVLLDEAFAGIDDEARASCMGLIREFDLDFVMTSEREWGCYAELPGLSICQLVRREGMDAVFVSRWTWDGRERRTDSDPVRRYPQSAASEP
ncbi:MAG: TIGR02680 family protein [Steroidobacteraceae bacterium]